MGRWVAGVVVGLMTAKIASYGHPDPLALLAPAAWMVVAGAVGQLLGRLAPYFVVAPVAGVIVYAALAWLVVRDTGVLGSLIPMDWRWMALYERATWISILQIYLAGALAVLILSFGRKTPRRIFVGSAATVLAVAVLLGSWGPAASRQPDFRAAELRCHKDKARVICLPAVKFFQRQQLERVWSMIDTVAPGLLARDFVFVDDEARGLSPDVDAQLNSVLGRLARKPTIAASESLDLSASAQVPQAQAIGQTLDLVVTLSPAPETADTSDPRSPATPALVVRSWLYRALDLPTDGSAFPGAAQIDDFTVNFDSRQREITWFAGLTSAERRSWWSAHADELLDGTLKWSAFDLR